MMKAIKTFGVLTASALFAVSVQARPPFLTELSYEKESVLGPTPISQNVGERRLDKYRPYLERNTVAETEIAAFEEVQGEPVDKTRRSFRHDRVN
ncbi:hypothetical protein [Zhongshania sp.]|uniref:hypothetical protein n=1 Tax=Zhongshania sp. TaxID=1971902 RepID=UPI001B6C10F9|nr:hypothetical protein [Zhongshania sp.]MBQ0794947.1 hypothetical protein [Zhongshania sp.]